MTPIVKEEYEIAETVEEGNDVDSAPMESMKMGGAVCIAAAITYILVPVLIYMVESCAKYMWK